MGHSRKWALAALVALLSCSDGSSGDGAPPPPPMRPGTAMVYEGARIRTISVLRPDLYYSLDVQDVQHDDAGFIVTVRASQAAAWVIAPAPIGCDTCTSVSTSVAGPTAFPILVSPDGASWREVRPGPFDGVYLLGVHRGPLRIGNAPPQVLTTLVGQGVNSTALGDFRYWLLKSADAQASSYVSSTGVDPAHRIYALPQVAGGRLAGAKRGDNRNNDLQVMRFDGTLSESATDSLPWARSNGGVLPSDGWRTANGHTFVTYAGFGTIQSGPKLCAVSVDVDATPLAPQLGTCTDRALWAGTGANAQPRIEAYVGSAGVFALVEDTSRGEVWRVDPDPRGPVTNTLLGTGRVRWPNPQSIRPAYGPFVRIEPTASDGAPAKAVFRDVGAGAVLDFPFPSSPCVNDADCADSNIVWITPLGNDDYQVFWSVQWDKTAAIHRLLYTRREHVVGVPITPTSDRSPIPAYPEAVPAGPVEKACLAADSCGAPARWCEFWWGSYLTSRSPALQRFARAATGGCAAVKDAWAVLDIKGKPCDPRSPCQGDVLVTDCANGGAGVNTVAAAIDCKMFGARCMRTSLGYACSDGTSQLACNTCTPTGGAVLCGQLGPPEADTSRSVVVRDCAAEGLECQAGGCRPRTGCPNGGETRCEGDWVVWCSQEAPSGPIVAHVRDCAALGSTCAVGPRGPWCDTPDKKSFDGPFSFAGCTPQCSGPYMLFCASPDDIHYADCRELGFTTCSESLCR